MGIRLRVGNIPASTSEQDLQRLFASFGSVDTVEVVRDSDSGRSKGLAYVTMTSGVEARKAIARLNFTQFDGLIMGVGLAPAVAAG